MNMKNLHSGFSLIEVLVALLVLTIGLLGMANLQGQSISSSYDAHLRTQATALARNIIDRMRANRNQAATTTNYETEFNVNPSLPGADCETSCTPEQMARHDLVEWKCNLGAYMSEDFCDGLVSQATLPKGDGQIEEHAATGQTKVTVRWTDSTGDIHQVVMFTSL